MASQNKDRLPLLWYDSKPFIIFLSPLNCIRTSCNCVPRMEDCFRMYIKNHLTTSYRAYDIISQNWLLCTWQWTSIIQLIPVPLISWILVVSHWLHSPSMAWRNFLVNNSIQIGLICPPFKGLKVCNKIYFLSNV